MSATAHQQEEMIVVGGATLTRTAGFEELYRELFEEAGWALEEEDLGWWVVLQEVLIPQIDAEIQSVSGDADGHRTTGDGAFSRSPTDG